MAQLSFRLDLEEPDPAPEFRNPDDSSSRFPDAAGRVRVGEYELLEEIGRGGMGVVYRARQVRLNRLVAVKLIPFGPLAGEEAVRRFRTEAEAVAQLQHPNIIAIHEVGESNGQQFFSMDYVPGGTLDDLLRPGPLPARRAAGYLQTIAKAVHYAHQRGILHRDLKPSNILIDDQDQPRITDFGLAKRVESGGPVPSSSGDPSTVPGPAPSLSRGRGSSATACSGPTQARVESLTLTGQVLGSPDYMAPEQASPAGGELGPRSDIYSMGAMLYHTVTGRPPFQAESVPALLVHLLNDDPVGPRALLPSIPRDLETICLKCLEKEPARRYASAEDLAADLGRFLADEPILAKPAGPVEKVWRWCRRKPALASMLALLLTVGLAGATGIVWEWLRAESAFRATRQNLYAADMELAYRAFVTGDLGYASQLLARHEPGPRQPGPDVRGWEWRYLWRRCQSQEHLLLGRHPGAVVALDYSPTGQWIASADVRGGLKIWDAATHRERLATNLLEGRINALTFSLDATLLAHTTRKEIWLWDARRWVGLDSLPQPDVSQLAFSPDGRLLAAADGHEVCLWNVAERKLWKRIPAARNRLEPRHVAFTPSGDLLAIADANGVMILWDWQADVERKGWRAHKPSADYEGTVEEIAFAPLLNQLATAGGDKTIRLWTRIPQYRLLSNHTEAVTSVSFTRDGHQLVSGSMDQTVQVWDMARERPLASWFAHPKGCSKVRWAPDARSFVSAGLDGTVKIWNPQPRPPEITMHSLPSNVVDVVVLPAASAAAFTTSEPGAQGWQVWKLPGFERTYQGRTRPDADLSLKGIFSGRIVEWTGRDIRFLRVADGQVEPFATSDQGEVGSVDLARAGGTLAVSAVDGVSLWDVASRQPTRRWSTPGEGLHRHVRLSPDGSCVATLQRFDGTVTFFDVRTGHQVALLGHLSGASVVGFSPDGRWLATAGLGSGLRVYDVRQRKEHLALDNRSGRITALAFSSDGRRLAGGTSKGPITMWDLGTGREVAWLTGHESQIYSLAFLDADTLASATREHVRLWTAR